MHALNLKQKPREKTEKGEMPIRSGHGAGETAKCVKTSMSRAPGVADSDELYNDKVKPGEAMKAKALEESTAMEVLEYLTRCRKRVRKGSIAVMGTGRPQRHSEEASNDRRAKVTHAIVEQWKRNTDTMQGVNKQWQQT